MYWIVLRKRAFAHVYSFLITSLNSYGVKESNWNAKLWNFYTKMINFQRKREKSKGIPIEDRRVRGSWGYLISWLSTKFVRPMQRNYLHTRRHSCYRLSRSQGHSVAGRIISMKYSRDNIGNRNCDVMVFSTAPQPTAATRVPYC